MWREFIGSRVKQMYAAVKAKGKFVFIHSCGKVQEIFPDLIGYGLDVFNPFQPDDGAVGALSHGLEIPGEFHRPNRSEEPARKQRRTQPKFDRRPPTWFDAVQF